MTLDQRLKQIEADQKEIKSQQQQIIELLGGKIATNRETGPVHTGRSPRKGDRNEKLTNEKLNQIVTRRRVVATKQKA